MEEQLQTLWNNGHVLVWLKIAGNVLPLHNKASRRLAPRESPVSASHLTIKALELQMCATICLLIGFLWGMVSCSLH